MPPPALLPANKKLEFVCPICKGALTTSRSDFHCKPCERDYPVESGIPDFRVFRDPYLSFSEDRARTQFVIKALNRLPLRELLTHYWGFSDVTPPLLREKFVENAMKGEARGQRLFDLVSHQGKQLPGRIIDIGCGTGNFLAIAARHTDQAVGIDIAMRWLHLSRRRFMDNKLELPALVCCCAEYLPFKSSSFDTVVMASTFEFLHNPAQSLIETVRILEDDGECWVNTVNRYSLAMNPYSHLWGVGFLPKPWQIAYVRKRRDANFENITLHSYPQIRKIALKYFFDIDIRLADISDETLATLPVRVRMLVRVYRVLKKRPLIRQILKLVAPEWDVCLSKPRSS